MSDKFTVEIISPDQTVLKLETNEVIILFNCSPKSTTNTDTRDSSTICLRSYFQQGN